MQNRNSVGEGRESCYVIIEEDISLEETFYRVNRTRGTRLAPQDLQVQGQVHSSLYFTALFIPSSILHRISARQMQNLPFKPPFQVFTFIISFSDFNASFICTIIFVKNDYSLKYTWYFISPLLKIFQCIKFITF